MTSTEQFIKTQLAMWESGQIEKYEFYASTMTLSAKVVSAVTGIEVDVIKDRRRYLRVANLLGQRS